MIPGSHIMNPFPLFNYKGFEETTTQNLYQTLVILEEGAIIRYFCNSAHQDQTEEEVSRLLILSPNNAAVHCVIALG